MVTILLCCSPLLELFPGLVVNPCPEKFINASYSKQSGSLGSSPSCASYFLLSITFSGFGGFFSHFRERPKPGIAGHAYYTTNI